jgi:hypothetical protein
MIMKSKLLLLSLVGVLILAACAPAAVEESVVEAPQEAAAPEVEVAPTEDPAPVEEAASVEVSFSSDIWPVIEQYALSAHGGRGGVFLESYEDIMNYVVPGQPENSRLYKALTGDGEKQMPPTGRLPEPIIQLFYDWISQGAPNN